MGRHRGIRGANNNKEEESKGPNNTTIRLALEATMTLSQHRTDDDLYHDQHDSSALM